MILKIIMMLSFFVTFAVSSYEQVSIGTIDNYYKNKISKEELRVMLNEIEYQLESQLGFNVFDYSSDGKPIDIMYVPPLELENKVASKLALLTRQQEKLEKSKNDFIKEQQELTKEQKILNMKTKKINKATRLLNNYIKSANKTKNLTETQYHKIKKHVIDKQELINKKINELKIEEKIFQDKLNSYNRKVSSYNRIIREYNHLNQEITRLSRSLRKVKGRTFGYKEISLKTYYKNGKKIKEKTIKNKMNKIEIYGFDSKKQLKAVLAHEIGHLVGIPHINNKHALMHPILQEKQVRSLQLSPADIRNFKRNF